MMHAKFDLVQVFFDNNFDEYVSAEDVMVIGRQVLDKGTVDKSLTHTLIK